MLLWVHTSVTAPPIIKTRDSLTATRRDAVTGVELHLGDLGGLVDLLFHFGFLLSCQNRFFAVYVHRHGRETTM